MAAPTIGVLALQGAFSAHSTSFHEVGLKVREIRRVADLEGLGGLMIPGGESTTLLNLMQDEPWFDSLRQLHDEGGILAGTCAGAILLSCDPATLCRYPKGEIDRQPGQCIALIHQS